MLKKGVTGLKLKISIFGCVCSRSFLTILKVFARGPTVATVFVRRPEKGAYGTS